MITLPAPSSPQHLNFEANAADIPPLRSKPGKSNLPDEDMCELVWSPSPHATNESIVGYLSSLKTDILKSKSLVSVHNPATNRLEAAMVLQTNTSSQSHPRMGPANGLPATVDVRMLKSGHRQTETITQIKGLFSEENALHALLKANWSQHQASQMVQQEAQVQLHQVYSAPNEYWTSKEVDKFQTITQNSKTPNLQSAQRQLKQKDWKQLVEEYYRTLHADDPFGKSNNASRRTNCFFCGSQGSYVMLCLSSKNCGHSICRSCCRVSFLFCPLLHPNLYSC
jgi:hypothetical protein